MRLDCVDGTYLDVRIRQWEEDDKISLYDMIQDCLDVNYKAGADMQPTFKNADVLWQMGLQASRRGEPCLVADHRNSDTPGPIGYTCWLEMPNPLGMDFRGRILHGLGTYVMPPFQRSGVSTLLRNEAEAQAGRLMFTKVVGIAYHDAGLKSVLSRSYRKVGTMVEKEVR